jgi:hypothetical protein
MLKKLINSIIRLYKEEEIILMKFKEYLNEMGFSKYPKGWSKDSVVKYGKTLEKEIGLTPKDEGFFDT